MSHEHKKVTRAAGVNSSATSLSRILGLIRDATLSYFFGTTGVNSSFLFAFSIPNLLRKLFGEGAMASSFVPLFADEIHNNGQDNAWNAANVTMTMLAALLTLIAVLIATGCLIATIWVTEDQSARLTLLLTAVMIPYCILICLTALCGAMLNTLGHFARPALAPVLLNIAIIAAAWLSKWLVPGTHTMSTHIYFVAIGVLIGGAAQLLYQIPALARRGYRFRAIWSLSHPFVTRIATIMAPAILGVGVTQVNVMVDRFLARIVNERGVSVLFYADRLVELPLGVFGVAVAVAVLPTISFCAAKNDDEGFTKAIAFALRQVCFIIIPAAVGLILLADPIITLLFQRGEFDIQSTEYTVKALRLYAIGLVGFSFVKIIVPAFYARKDTRTPVIIGACVLVLNITLNLILMQFMEERGLALSTSICAYVNAFVLLYMLRRRCGPLGMRIVAGSLIKTCILSAIMGVCVYASMQWCAHITSATHFIGKCIQAGVPLFIGLASYTVLSFATGQIEMKELLGAYLDKKLRKK